MNANLPYKTLFVGTLVQKTGFSIGGNQPHERVDAPLCRDGAGRPVLRGSGLAGALLATARTLYCALPETLTAGTPKQQIEALTQRRNTPGYQPENELRLEESLWRVFNSHPLQPSGAFDDQPASEYRAGVGILQRTGAAAEGVKFDTETLPSGTRWWLCLEVDDYREDTELRPEQLSISAAIAANVLKEWQEGRCWLGRDVARGLGWMVLEELKVHRLDAVHIAHWPQSDCEPWQVIQQLPTETVLNHQGWRQLLQRKPPDRPRHGLAGRGIVCVGLDDFDQETRYGLDTLSVGATELMRPHQTWSSHYLQTEGMAETAAQDDFDPDHLLAWTRQASNLADSATATGFKPYIPGSSLRGPWRHMLSWWLRSRQGKTIGDPNSTHSTFSDEVAELFGTTEHSAVLLLSDACLCNDDYQVALLELHAEDEFTAGTYEGAKFNQLCLLKGQFSFEFMIEAGSAEKLQHFIALLRILQQLGKARFLPLGAGKWRGQGWVQWTIELPDIEKLTADAPLDTIL